jgi:hypothetical protein
MWPLRCRAAEADRSRKGLLQFAHGAWTDALSCSVVQQDLSVGFLSIHPGIRLYEVEVVKTGDCVERKKIQENQGFTAKRGENRVGT